MEQQVIELSKNVRKTEVNWLNAARGEALPYRSDISGVDPDYQFILELTDTGALKMRQVGLFVEALFGASLAGRDFVTLFAEPHQKQCRALLEEVFEGSNKAVLETYSEAGDVQFGLYPVTSDYGPVNYALGGVSLESLPNTHTLMLGMYQMETIALHQEVEEKKYGFAEARAGFSGPGQKSGFRVIEGGGGFAPQTRPGLRVINNVKREP